jgi:hypothetical protein
VSDFSGVILARSIVCETEEFFGDLEVDGTESWIKFEVQVEICS